MGRLAPSVMIIRRDAGRLSTGGGGRIHCGRGGRRRSWRSRGRCRSCGGGSGGLACGCVRSGRGCSGRREGGDGSTKSNDGDERRRTDAIIDIRVSKIRDMGDIVCLDSDSTR